MRNIVATSVVVTCVIVGSIAYAQGLTGKNAKAAVRCSLAIGNAANGFVAKKQASLKKCADLVFTCVQLKPEDPACLEKAEIICGKQSEKIAGAESKLVRAITRKCRGRLSEADLVSAAGLAFGSGELQARCAAAGVASVASLADVAECIRRDHACRVEDLFAVQMPAAESLLALVGRTLHDSSCPGAAQPTPVATATGSTPEPTVGATASSVAGETPEPQSTTTPTPAGVTTATLTPIVMPTPAHTSAPLPTATALATPNPLPTAVCGDGEVEDDEQCDGANLDDNTCDDLCNDEPDPPGPLACNPDCTFDFSGCLGIGCEAF